MNVRPVAALPSWIETTEFGSWATAEGEDMPDVDAIIIAEWKRRFLLACPDGEEQSVWMNRRRDLWSADGQQAVSRAIGAFEQEVGRVLPRSWKAFAHVWGAGKLGWYEIHVPCAGKGDVERGWLKWVSGYETHPHARWTEPAIRGWLPDSVLFGRGDNEDFLVWNTSKLTDKAGMEYEVVELNARDMSRMKAFDSFEALWVNEAEKHRTADSPYPLFKPY